MSDVVVDSSVVAKWILPEADSAQAQRVLAETASRGERTVVLDLAYAEVANAIWKRHHQGLASAWEVRAFLDTLLRCPVHVEPARPLLVPAMEIAVKYQRALYDALFLALAQHLATAGVTADEPLYRAVHADMPRVILLRDW